DGAELALLDAPLRGHDDLIPCLFDPDWHPGVVGLVASKLKERLHRPVLAFAPGEADSPWLRGSARSIPGFHLRDALAAVDAQHPGLIERFGGHAMAAGLTLHRDHLDALRASLAEVAAERLSPELLLAEHWSDGPLQADEFRRDIADLLRLGGPWGQGFPEPCFDNVFSVAGWRVVGERHLKLQLLPEGSRGQVPAIHFGGWSGEPPPPRIHALYQLDIDDWQGRGGVQLLIRQWDGA
ncbi:MAG TPA: DHHA1 domain-containing protein, partial [Arenimonas sp.]|nr:DHHA1 domain-containing protein [Arenimonas sp.]